MTNPKLDEILEHTVGSRETLRLSLDKSKCVVKTPCDHDGNCPVLVPIKSYTHSEILEVMALDEWTVKELY